LNEFPTDVCEAVNTTDHTGRRELIGRNFIVAARFVRPKPLVTTGYTEITALLSLLVIVQSLKEKGWSA
jgi:hypothetical protein